MPPVNPKPLFAKGSSVRIKAGVKCPDFAGLVIGGWQGRVAEVEEAEDGNGHLVLVRWDSHTLKAMTDDFLADSEKKGASPAEMYLGQGELEPASPRDTERDADRAVRTAEDRAFWLGEGKVGAMVLSVVGDIAPDREGARFEAWEVHLRKTLRFPFEAKVCDPQEDSPMRTGERVSVLDIEETDDMYGVLVRVKSRSANMCPLADLAATDRKSPYWLSVEAYREWFANR